MIIIIVITLILLILSFVYVSNYYQLRESMDSSIPGADYTTYAANAEDYPYVSSTTSTEASTSSTESSSESSTETTIDESYVEYDESTSSSTESLTTESLTTESSTTESSTTDSTETDDDDDDDDDDDTTSDCANSTSDCCGTSCATCSDDQFCCPNACGCVNSSSSSSSSGTSSTCSESLNSYYNAKVETEEGTTSKMSPWAESILSYTNNVRAQCSSDTPSLEWDPALAAYAEDYAYQLANNNDCTLSHDMSVDGVTHGSYCQMGAGENLFMSSSTDTDGLAKGAVNAWGNEGYDQSGNYGSDYGHYTAMNWNTTKKLGCGYAKKGTNCGITVCNYRDDSPNSTASGTYNNYVQCGDKLSVN